MKRPAHGIRCIRIHSLCHEIDAVKRNWLPQVIMSDDFASTWDAYMAAYQKCDPQDYFDILQRHVDQILR